MPIIIPRLGPKKVPRASLNSAHIAAVMYRPRIPVKAAIAPLPAVWLLMNPIPAMTVLNGPHFQRLFLSVILNGVVQKQWQ